MMVTRDWQNLFRRACVLLAAIQSAACGAGEGDLAQLKQAQSTIPNTGFVAYPIQTDLVAGEVQPRLGPDGSYLPAWDGTVAELMAADAFADCLSNTSYTKIVHPTQTPPAPLPTDQYIRWLAAKMDGWSCEPDNPEDPFFFPRAWIRNRQSPSCNVDPQSGAPDVVEFDSRGFNQYDSFHGVFDNAWQSFTQDLFLFEKALVKGGVELEYAHLNLCMAQRLRSQLNGGQSLFTPTNDQVEILAVIRERAQLAVVHYGLLAKVFSSTDTVPTQIDDPDFDFLTLIRHWAEQTDPSDLQQTGEDFALAVRLHLEATFELARLLERQAATRPVSGAGLSRADRDWGLGQPRVRLMNLLYGGDPIGTPGLEPKPGRSRGGVGRFGTLPEYVKADMRDPRVGTFLGLASAADALLFRVEPGEFGEPQAFDVAASAERMYRKVEVDLRSQACERETPGDPGCAAEAIEPTLPDVSQTDEYLLWQEHRLELLQATTLAQSFAEAFGGLVRELPLLPLSNAVHRSNDGKLHLLGSHQTETIDDEPWIHVDPEFTTAPFSGHELMIDFAELAYLPKEIEFEGDARGQGFITTDEEDRSNGAWERIRNLGAVPALAFVREAIVEGSEAPSFAQPFFSAASTALADVERAVGRRTVIMRPKRALVSTACTVDAAPGATCFRFGAEFGSSPRHEVDVVTRSDDPTDTLIVAPQSHQLHTIAVDADSVGFDGVDRAVLDGYSGIVGTTQSYSGFGLGYERRVFDYEFEEEPVRSVLLRGDDPETQGQKIYMYLFGHRLTTHEAYYASLGGSLNGIGERAASVLSQDWSRPAFDAFGFPVDWVPPADASLVGGAPGEPSYQYFLRSAKEAAQEATQAVQRAMDNLLEETLQQVELEVAEQRAETISELEVRALCGVHQSCELQTEAWEAPVPSCSGVVSDDAFCNQARKVLIQLLPTVDVASAALRTGSGPAPRLPGLEGSEAERVLVRQWNALRILIRAVRTAMETAIGASLQRQAAEAAESESMDALALVQAEINDRINELDVEGLSLQGQIAALNQARATLDNDLIIARDQMVRQCGNSAIDRAIAAGRSWSDVESVNRNEVTFDGQRSWSAGPLIAQGDRCFEAMQAWKTMGKLYESQKDAIKVQEDALLAHHETLIPSERELLIARGVAAESTADAAVKALAVVNQASATQLSASLQQVQQAVGELAAGVAELEQVRLRTENAVASATLERDLVEKQADVRFGLQRKFRSYDMWRARALLESARRLSVAARRAIEARFVVDLSDLESPQAFVDSPSIWADEVYGTDLDAPSVVGLSAAPTVENAVYPNQLLDYVGNLERFVQGYTVSYPTSVAAPDTEVITLPGPEAVTLIEEAGEVSEVLSGDSSGWSFFCPDQDAWLSHPGTGELPLVSRLATLCDGAPPPRMRYAFSLDPWGRLDRSIASSDLTQRHNVRWRQLAVNLVGTGIRDCQLAADPLSCFSEPFLKFQLTHSGPAWVTNHGQQWRAFDLPAAFIENGKALASEEWLDPISNSWNVSHVASVTRGELFGRPVSGGYELIVELPQDVRLERIERVQLLVQTDYWVRQQ